MIFDKLRELQGKEIGFTCSSFDLLHSGHVAMLAEARSHCDYLVVGLQVDPTIDRPEKNFPIQSIVDRQIQLMLIKYIDDIFVYNTEKDLENLLMILPITVRIIGEEYREIEFTGRELCKEKGIRIVYNSRFHKFSTSELRKRIANIDTSDI